MTTEIFFSSKKIGEVTDDQLQRMLDRFHLGKLISAEKTPNGVMRQTMFVLTSSGEYVLKGNPLFQGQFIEERYFVENLLNRTKLTVPSPYLIDESADIFGWSYSLMPRLHGHHMNAPEVQEKLNYADKIQIAELLSKTLGVLHRWKVDQYGEFDTLNQTIRPFKGSYKTWLYSTIRYWLEDAKKYSVITSDDIEWAEGILESAEDIFEALNSPSFVMGDFKPENFLLQPRSGRWQCSGLFDFTNSYFGDPAADLPRMTAFYLDSGEEEMARRFLSDYFNQSGLKASFAERFRVHMLHQRILDWGCAKAIKNVTWDNDLSFSNWAAKYTEFAMSLLR